MNNPQARAVGIVASTIVGQNQRLNGLVTHFANRNHVILGIKAE